MGEVTWHPITMLVSDDQEDAIRFLFKLNKWKCWMKVLSDEQISWTKTKAIFPDMADDGRSDDEITSQLSDDGEVESEVPCTDSGTVGKGYNEDSDTDIDEPVPNDDVLYEEKDAKTIRTSVKRGIKADTEIKTTVNKKKPKVKCTLCDMYCANSTILKRHCLRRHKDVWLEFECKDCDLRFKTKEELWEHRREVKHECPKKIPRKYDKANHTPEELKAMGLLSCQACDKFYPNKRMLRCHMYTCHKEMMPKWNCPICDVEFKTREELWKHKRESQHNTSLWRLGNYMCDTCGKIFSRYDGFKVHKNTFCGMTEEDIEELPKVKCDICGAMFKSEHRVKAHKRQVHVEAPEVCHICGALCKNKRGLALHQKRHDASNRKFVCDECGKAFFSNTLLKQHIRVHTKEKPYKCPLCNQRCAIKQNILKHASKVHKTHVVPIDLSREKDQVSTTVPEILDNNASYAENGTKQLDSSTGIIQQTDILNNVEHSDVNTTCRSSNGHSPVVGDYSVEQQSRSAASDYSVASGTAQLGIKPVDNSTYYMNSDITVSNTITYSRDLVDRSGPEMSVNEPETNNEQARYSTLIGRLNVEPQQGYLPEDIPGSVQYQTHLINNGPVVNNGPIVNNGPLVNSGPVVNNGPVVMGTKPENQPLDYSGMIKYEMSHPEYHQQQQQQQHGLQSLQYSYNWVQSNNS